MISYLLHRPQLAAMRRDLEAMRARLEAAETTEEADAPDATVDYIGACAIVDRYIEPALRDKRSSVRLSVRNNFVEQFGKMTGARLGECVYNRALLHQWMESNAARFLVENRHEMR